MTNNEVNKVIAKYMDHPSYMINHHMHTKFTNSLDALVPVWEKARISNVCQFDFNRIGNNYEFTIFQDRPDKNYGNQWYAKEPTIQEAAAHATAKAILALGEK